MTRALVIAAHGSHYAAGTALPAWAAVDTIRQTGLFDEVTAAFWKEQPSFGIVLETLQSDDVTIVPMFSSEGYFTQSVLPAELNPRPDQNVRITESVGRSEYFVPLIQSRVEEALQRLDAPYSHGNPLSGSPPQAGQPPLYLSPAGRGENPFPRKQNPLSGSPPQAGERISFPRTQNPLSRSLPRRQGREGSLPLSTGEGVGDRGSVAVVIVGHGTSKHEDSQRATTEQAERLYQTGQYGEVRTAYLDEAPFIRDIYRITSCPTLVIVPFFISEGLHTQADIPALLNLQEPIYEPQQVEDRVVIYTRPVGLEADLYRVALWLAGHDPETRLTGSVWDNLPLPPAELLDETAIGDISLQQADYLCHIADEHGPIDALESLETPAEIRAALRTNKTGKFRALSTSLDLPDGWKIMTSTSQRRLAALETIYPGLAAVNGRRSALEVGQRQKGKYRPVAALSEARIKRIVETVCAGCARQPTWHTGEVSLIGCSEPCSIWLEEGLR